jgi:transposase
LNNINEYIKKGGAVENISGNIVGVDYHDKNLQVCVMSQSGEVLVNRSCNNNTGEVIGLVSKYGNVKSVCAEACNGSVEFLEELSKYTGWSKRLCHPGYVSRMKHNPDKSDKSDGELIADLERVDYLPQVWFAPIGIRDLRTLVRYRAQQLSRRKQAKLRIRSLLRQYRIRWEGKSGLWTRKGVQWLESLTSFPEQTQWVFKKHLIELSLSDAELKESEKKLREYSKNDRLIQFLMGKPGIGLIVATAMRAEIGEFNRFRTGKELSRFCGVSPRNASSGARQADAGLIKAGSPLLKTAVIEAAHKIIRSQPRWKQLAQRLCASGKPYPLVVAAVANRWLRALFWEVREVKLVVG